MAKKIGKYQISIFFTNYGNEFSEKKSNFQILKMNSQIHANNKQSPDTNFKVIGEHGWANFMIEKSVLWVGVES